MKIYIIYILKSRLQFICVASMAFREESIKTEVKVRVEKLKNRKAAGKDEITGEMVKDEGDMVVDWIWRLLKVV